MRRIFLASEAMSIKIPDKIETILINIHQRLRANPPHTSPRLARHQTRAGATRWGPQFWHWYCGEYTIYAANTETVQTSERLLLTNLPNMWRQLVSIPTSGSFQQLMPSQMIVYLSQCDCQNWRAGAIPDADGWCLVSQDSWLIGCGIWDEGWEDQDTRSGDLAPHHPVTQLIPSPWVWDIFRNHSIPVQCV